MRSLHPGAVYVRLKVVRLVGIMLVLAVQEKHKQYVLIDELFTDTVGTGIMGKMVHYTNAYTYTYIIHIAVLLNCRVIKVV